MPSLIRKLDDTLINQIAAGEVVEHPASVIKEMVENSLDAGATSIFIEVRGSGRQLIRITDNGSGMGEEDAILAFKRHTTSKIASIDDFEALASMGFRGEALASIASVSKVSMQTRPHTANMGTLIQIEGGGEAKASSIPCSGGTSLEVTDLFFNVPARKKFLKSPAQDGLEIQKTVIQLALANPKVHFQLIADQKLVLDAPPSTSHLDRAKLVLHAEMVEGMQSILFAEGDFKLEGLIGSPSQHRPNKTGQWLFINGRAVSSWVITQAVLDGYSTLLPERRFPIFVLHLTLSPSFVDVNVHPQKKEVRFRHESLLREFVQKGIQKQWEKKPVFQPVFIEKALPPPSWSKPIPLKETFTPSPLVLKEPQEVTFFEDKSTLPLPNVLGTSSSYIFLEKHPLKNGEKEGFCILDYKKAQARILYEQVLDAQKRRCQERQILLIPLTFHLSNEEMLQLPKLDAIGFTVKKERCSCTIEAIPPFLKDNEVEDIIKQLLNEDKEVDLAKRFALKVAMREKMGKIDLQEAKLLMKTLQSCQQPYFSPRGEPLFAWIPNVELAGYFK